MKSRINKSITQDEFFQQLALNSGRDMSSCKDIYYGLIKTIARELKNRRTVKLPDWGDFKLSIYKEREIIDINDKTKKYIPPKPVVKFVPDYKVKAYFRSLDN